MKGVFQENRQVRFNRVDLRPPPQAGRRAPSAVNEHEQIHYRRGE